MLTFEEIAIIMTRNDQAGLICRSAKDVINGVSSINYKIDIKDITPNDHIYVYQIDGYRCLKVTDDHSFIAITRDKKDGINGFLVYIGTEKDMMTIKNKFDNTCKSSIEIISMIKMRKYVNTYLTVKAKGIDVIEYSKMHQILSHSCATGINIYTRHGIGKLERYDPNQNDIELEMIDKTKMKLKTSHVFLYNLYPSVNNGYFIGGYDFDEICKIINDHELYEKLGGEYIEDVGNSEKKYVCKAHGEIFINMKTKQMVVNPK